MLPQKLGKFCKGDLRMVRIGMCLPTRISPRGWIWQRGQMGHARMQTL
jgi:hypothetical protein